MPRGRTDGIFLLDPHGADRARERNIDIGDIGHALRGSTTAVLQANRRWSVSGGSDLEGAPVTLVVRFAPGLVIVTLF